MQQAKAYLVESIPTGMESFRSIDGVAYTEDVLISLVMATKKRIDLMAMYWSLLADTDTPDCSDLEQDRLKTLGVENGSRLFQALEGAARRGVRIRVLQSPGFIDGPQEPDRLAARFPARFQVRQVDMAAWYGGGIMHQKLWLFDERSLYLGSTNMDWRSLSQVKELGLVLEDQPQMAADLLRYYDAWWCFAGLSPSPACGVWDPKVGVERSVPPWSTLRSAAERGPSPIERPAWEPLSSMEHPIPLSLDGRQGGIFLTGSPPELCVGGRTFDLDALLETIQKAERQISVSVMTYSATSRCRQLTGNVGSQNADQPTIDIWWPILDHALLRAAITSGVKVRLLVSEWAHTQSAAIDSLKALEFTAKAALGHENAADHDACGGSLEIKLFRVPGWDRTEAGPNRRFPGHSRVNHPKFVVTDQRLHLSTSNMTWSYFAQSAGCSLNTDHLDLVEKAQEVFDRDWCSPYALPLMDRPRG